MYEDKRGQKSAVKAGRKKTREAGKEPFAGKTDPGFPARNAFF
jgi:hypothetical protein